MIARLVISWESIRSEPGDVIGLSGQLTPLIGEPFRFARVSYGDELTLHFGDLKPARSPKLAGKSYGTYILGLRASPWVLKSSSQRVALTAGGVFDPASIVAGEQLTNADFESKPFITPESRVLSATPFVVQSANVYGLQLRLSDGSSLVILPATNDPTEPCDEPLPEIADWELLSPPGTLHVGPNLTWSFGPNS